ncbi:MAG: ammonia channel protein [Planctomycetes bacterium GWF2_41_51]|nr:MAG: ammonia channel protein [Planctomycetes bacterium GWF2_41_51]
MKVSVRKLICCAFFLTIPACLCFAQDSAAVPKADTGDTAWILMSAALVMLMTPGLAFFYGGLVRRKNYLSVLMQCFIALAVLSIHWVIIGYSISFAPGNGFIGGLQWFGLKGVSLEPYSDYGATIPHQAFMIFQAMFAIITPALIIGAFAERMKFSAYLVFILLWATFIYDPMAHWVWGTGGWLRNMGVLDFAGGTVVHINAGIAALVAALVIGRRSCYDKYAIAPHNLPFSVLGAALLWFGWFGFNAGSALGANGIAVNAFVVTNTAGAAAALTWAVIDWKLNGNPTMLGTISGAIAGLAAITPAAGYVGIWSALIIGITASIFCFIAVSYIKRAFNYDDSLDAFGVHGISGFWGTIAAGLFASKAINPLGADGLFAGNPKQLYIQLIAVAATFGYALIGTYIIFKIVDVFIGVRATHENETIGLDLSEHNERAYTMLE